MVPPAPRGRADQLAGAGRRDECGDHRCRYNVCGGFRGPRIHNHEGGGFLKMGRGLANSRLDRNQSTPPPDTTLLNTLIHQAIPLPWVVLDIGACLLGAGLLWTGAGIWSRIPTAGGE